MNLNANILHMYVQVVWLDCNILRINIPKTSIREIKNDKISLTLN